MSIVASQHHPTGLLLARAQEQQSFRLLELPDALVELLSSPNPPLLTVKSRPAPPSAIAQAQKESYAYLCTPNKTYQLRQVHTSNSVLIAEPTSLSETPAFSTIAQCGSMLELRPVADSPRPLLQEALAECDDVRRDDAAGPALNGGPLTSKSKAEVFADVPFSDEECERAWVDMCAFDLNGVPSYPSARTPWTYWKAIHALSVAEGIDLGAQLQIRDVQRQLEEEGLLPQLIAAIFLRLLPDDQLPEPDWTVVDRAKCVPWVGKHLLIALDSLDSELPTASFLDQWRDALPEAWRSDVALEAIKDDYVLPTEHHIAPKGSALTQYRRTASAGNDKGAAAAAAAEKGPVKRKWHEKFKASRRPPQ
ncbi:uncharacterized protein K452DRAFT_224820 [Aplosporella prunicola CBS 121167]|uniref:Sister chromatid cohesion protein Dcc1 n=1 Tax=Aplosporella prunicola CBS 121167 TaxID=1176127 RepID=A0A6A6BIU0_9PEZI|nr:uncharacterized protein K452DRAFT_224820 [Aplosporella prunicola CBS 121167]KAF2143558.1 hypothetical protein K452DRAFT_224820 [Aplosporella prunicola CBS 121167]